MLTGRRMTLKDWFSGQNILQNQSDYVVFETGNANDKHKWVVTSELPNGTPGRVFLDCCYSSECPQSRENPKVCDCVYAVRCEK